MDGGKIDLEVRRLRGSIMDYDFEDAFADELEMLRERDGE